MTARKGEKKLMVALICSTWQIEKNVVVSSEMGTRVIR